MADPIEALQKQVDNLNKFIQRAKFLAQEEFIQLLRNEAREHMDEAFRLRSLGQESPAKMREETAKHFLSLISSLPTKLRGK